MANTFTQLHIQFVFAVKYRKALIDKAWKENLHRYITGIFQQNEHKMLQINSVPDHIHIFAGMRPHQSISSLMQNVKTESGKWIKEMDFAKDFAWQEGYGAFSYCKRHVPGAKVYSKPGADPSTEKFLDEYRRMLKEFEVEYNDQYIFTEPI